MLPMPIASSTASIGSSVRNCCDGGPRLALETGAGDGCLPLRREVDSGSALCSDVEQSSNVVTRVVVEIDVRPMSSENLAVWCRRGVGSRLSLAVVVVLALAATATRGGAQP